MKYVKITYTDVNNGLGNRVTLWISGCSHHCKGCHNPETWDFNYGREFDEEVENKLFEILDLPYVKGLTLSGGDPIDSAEDVLELVKKVKQKFPKKDIWLYTGYCFNKDFVKFNGIEEYVDVIVDGPFVEELRDTTLAFKGSRNQRTIFKTENGWVVKES